jgi:hypothetical protein
MSDKRTLVDVQYPQTSARTSSSEGRLIASAFWRGSFGFAVLWIFFFSLFKIFPYVSTGAAVVYRAKIRKQTKGLIFPIDQSINRVVIFGDSKELAGFIPKYFDDLAASDGLKFYSYNSGYPARTFFVPQLATMVGHERAIPNILLLTSPWQPRREAFSIFNPLEDDHGTAELLFPFRYFVRDSVSFLVTSRLHGGPLRFYRQSKNNEAKMLMDRGYYFVSEQSHYPHDSLPDDYRQSSDTPGSEMSRSADFSSVELKALNEIVANYHIRCYYVPQYVRIGEYAPAPKVDRVFADMLQRRSSCKLLGPDYYSYENRLFSDPVHLNPEGARIYTRDIYNLLSQVEKGR